MSARTDALDALLASAVPDAPLERAGAVADHASAIALIGDLTFAAALRRAAHGTVGAVASILHRYGIGRRDVNAVVAVMHGALTPKSERDDDDAEPTRWIPAGAGGGEYAEIDGVIWHHPPPGPDGARPARQLTSWNARIVEDITIDDGAEPRRVYRIAVAPSPDGDIIIATVAATAFADLGWVATSCGARVALPALPADRARLREAIQLLSSPARSTIFEQTGIVTLPDGRRAYLHAGGAIHAVGAVGLAADVVEVSLPAPLDRYRLPSVQPDAKALRAAVAASLRLLRCGPPEMMIPIVAQVAAGPLAALTRIDYAVWISGLTGTLKTARTELALRHYAMADGRPTTTWTSTVASIEKLLHRAAHSVIAIDDYAPQPDARTQAALVATVATTVRNVGNGSSRARMRADMTSRPELPPRCAVIATGEDVPQGASIKARLFVVEAGDPAPYMAAITASQAEAGLYATAMYGYIQSVLAHYDQLAATIEGRLIELRDKAASEGAHRRQPDQVARLYYAFRLYVEYAEGLGVLSETETDDLLALAWRSLNQSAQREATSIAELDPAEALVAEVRTLLAQRRIKLRDLCVADDLIEVPPNNGEIVGFVDRDMTYLMPDATINAIAAAQRRAGGHWPHSRRACATALQRRGYLIDCEEGRTTRRVQTDEGRVYCWAIPRAKLLDMEINAPPRVAPRERGLRIPLAGLRAVGASDGRPRTDN